MRSVPYLVVIGALVALALALFLCVDHVEASPGRRKSGGGLGGWFGGKKKPQQPTNIGGGGWVNNNKKNYGSGGSGGYKKKSKTIKNLKKAAVIGAVAYGGYQLGKLSSGFGGWGWGQAHGYQFNDWNKWREVDGFLCRESSDCNWIDSRLYCQDYELDFQPSALWFGGDVTRIVGECACPRGMVFDDREMQCETNYFSGTTLLLIILIPILLLCCCCCGAIFIIRKMCF